MRITGGRARSIPIKCPKGNQVRPATDRMREAVFSSLGPLLEGARFLDLFAGTGAYGLESISRGAIAGRFVEQDRRALSCLRENLRAVLKSTAGHEDSPDFKIHEADVFRWIENSGDLSGIPALDLVFVDPPYADWERKGTDFLKNLVPFFDSSTGAFIVLEAAEKIENLPAGFECIRTYGKGREDTRAMLLKWQAI